MLTGWLFGAPRLRIAALVMGSLAALAMVIVGCSSVTQGTAKVDAAEAPVYQASVSASLEESVASSSARESERQESLTTQAIHTSCEALSSSSVDAITAVNGFVKSMNENASDAQSRAVPAIDSLNRSADLVGRSMSDELVPELRDALTAWIDAARGVAAAISAQRRAGRIQHRGHQLNDSRSVALTLCDASY